MQAMQRVVLSWAQVMLAPVVHPLSPSCCEGPAALHSNLAGEFGVDASFHTAEWHAARIAALTTERMSWEDWKKQQKEEALSAEAMVRASTRCMPMLPACGSTAVLL